MGFQTSVNTVPAPAVAGDFCDSNPRFAVDAGPGGLVTGPAGVTIGRFAWATPSPADPDGAATQVNNFGSGPVTGFVHREQQGLITAFLAEGSMVIPQGMNITLMSGGGFWVKNEGATQAVPGQYAYASFANGAASFAAAGAPSTASITGSSIAAVSMTITGYIVGNVLTVTGTTGGGPIVAGAVLSGTASNGSITSGTQIVAQLSGTQTGGNGTYSLSNTEMTVGSSGSGTNITATYGILTVGTLASGTVGVGGSVGGTGVAASTIITQLGTGTGGAGTYYVSVSQTVSSSSWTVGQNVVTKWIAMSAGVAGELVKITDHALG